MSKSYPPQSSAANHQCMVVGNRAAELSRDGSAQPIAARRARFQGDRSINSQHFASDHFPNSKFAHTLVKVIALLVGPCREREPAWRSSITLGLDLAGRREIACFIVGKPALDSTLRIKPSFLFKRLQQFPRCAAPSVKVPARKRYVRFPELNNCVFEGGQVVKAI